MARRPVDEKIVKLSMDNSDLTQKAQESTSLLSKLRDGLNKIPGVNLGKTTQELSNIGSATKNVPMDALGQAVSNVSSRFSAMGIIGMTVMQNITNRAVDMGIKLAKSLTIDQIGDGFREYELKMGSIRTIMANTEHEGATLANVKTSLEDLNRYADLTIYNFGQMTDSIGRFTAAGVGLDDSTVAIKGMSNLAATSGATTHQLNSAMYQMSQAMAAGRFNLMDWNSLVNSGMGGKITQDGLRKTAEEMGVAIDMSEGFRESLKDGWLTSEIFLKTMKTFAEDESMLEAATKIRTFTQLMDTVKESIGSGLGMTFEHILGDFEEASELFSNLGNSMTGWIDNTMDRFNAFVGAIADGGGFLNIFKGLGNILKPVGQVLGAVADGFGKAFKSITPEVIVNATEKFLRFTESLKLSEGTVKVLTSIFEHFFTGIRLGFTAIKNVANIVGPPLMALGKRIASIFEGFTISMPSISGVIRAFSLGTATALSNMGSWLGELLSNSAFEGLRRLGAHIKSLTTIFNYHYSETASVFKSLYNVVKEYLKYLNVNFESFSEFMKSMATAVGNVLGPVWDLVKDIFSGLEFKHFLGGGFLVGVWGIVKKLIENMDGLSGVWKGIKDFIDVMKDSSSNKTSFLDNISESISGFSASLKEGVTLGRIVAIATAIGILAVSMKVLEDLDTAQITRGMAAIAGAMATLSFGMKALDGVDIGGVGGVKVIAFATAVTIMTKSMKSLSELDASSALKGAIGLAAVTGILTTAIAVLGNAGGIETGPIKMIALATAIKILVSTLDDIDAVRVEGLVKGIGTIGLLLAGLATFSNVMNGVKIKMSTALSIAAIAGVMHILVDAIRKIDDIRVEGLIKGLGTIGILLAEIAVFGNVMNGIKLGPGKALGVLGIAAAMQVMAKAIKQIDDIRVEGLIKGLGTIGIVLAEIAVFSNVTRSTNLTSSAIGLGLIAGAIKILVPPLKDLGNTRWQDLVKGLGTMAGALGAMAIAGQIASGTISGAIAIGIMALSLDQLIDPIERMQTISWGDLLSSLLKLGTALAVVAGASLLLSPAVGPMLGFSAALVGFGAAIALIGGGLALFGTGLTTLAGLTATSVAAILAAVEMLLDGFIGLLDKIGETLGAVITLIVTVIRENIGTIVTAVIEVILAILTGIDEYLPKFIEKGTSIILNLMAGIEENDEKLALAGTDMIISLIDAMSVTIDKNGEKIIKSFTGLVGQILILLVEAGTELIIVVGGWIPGLKTTVEGMGEEMTSAIRRTFGLDKEVDEKLQRGGYNIDKAKPGMSNKTGSLGKGASTEFNRQFIIDKYGKEKGEAMLRNIDQQQGKAHKSGAGLGKSGASGLKSVSWDGAAGELVSGFSGGISRRSGMGSSIWSAAWNMGKSALSAIRKAIGSNSPAKETIKEGENFGMGLINGIAGLTSRVGQTAGTMARQAVDTTNYFLDDLMSDMDREVQVKVVLDTSEIDEWDPRGFSPLRPDTSFTNRMVSESQPRTSQNEDTFNRNEVGTSNTNEYNYDVHIHATGALPRATIRDMAVQFKDEIDTIDRRNRVNRGEEVVY